MSRRETGPRKAAKGRLVLFGCALLGLQALLILAAVVMEDPSQARRGPAGGAGTEQRQAAHSGHGAEEDRVPHLADEMLYTYDIEDERIVIGLSDNVFAGRVRRATGAQPAKSTIPGDRGRPQAQFSVDVVASAKATGPDPVRSGERVVVNQEVGRDPKSGRTVPIEAAFCGRHRPDELLEPGATYVFATFHEPTRDLHTLTAQPTGKVRVNGTAEAKTLLSAFERYETEGVDPATGKIEGAKPCE